MVCNSSWHIPGNPKLVWQRARLIKEWGCVNLSIDTMHLKDHLVLLGLEGSAISFRLFLRSHRINMLCHCSSTMANHFFEKRYVTDWPCVPLSTYSFIQTWMSTSLCSYFEVIAIWIRQPYLPTLNQWVSYLSSNGNKFLTFSVYILCLVRILLHIS